MPLTLVALAKATKAAAFEYLDETVNIEYKLAAITPQFITEVGGLSELSAFATKIAEVVTSWDMQAEPGTPFPLTPADLASLPVHFLSTVLMEIIKDARPGEGTAPKAQA